MTSDERIAAIEAAHQPYEDEGQPLCPKCIHFEPNEYDSTPDDWPCDTAIALQRLREVEQERDDYRDAAEAGALGPGTLLDGYQRIKAERDAARAEIKRLEEHLRRVIAAHEENE